jgi:phosphatidylcholine synthase
VVCPSGVTSRRLFAASSPVLPVVGAWCVHLYTASGAVLALLAAQDIFQYRYRNAFFWLSLQIVVDATDGVLARWAKVSERTPGFLGARLDDIVDYVAYVFVPALFVWRSLIVPGAWTLAVCSAMLLASAYGFSRQDAKTDDHFFTGFPSYWNIVAFYLLLGGASQQVNGVILLTLSALVFVPIRYVYPSRTPVLRATTMGLGVVWAGLMMWMLWRMPVIPRPVFWLSLAFPVYYTGLSLVLNARRHAGS